MLKKLEQLSFRFEGCLNLRLEASSVKEAAGVDEKDTSADVIEEDDSGLATQPFEEVLTPPSPKVTALTEALVLMKAEDDKNLKAAVFSQFTSFLNVIGRHLEHAGIKFSRLDGGMSMKRRTTELSHWRTLNSAATSTSVLLISTKAGGQGLNLMQGSRVFLMDPLWNSASEYQAMDRCHRLGQTRKVVVTRYM